MSLESWRTEGHRGESACIQVGSAHCCTSATPSPGLHESKFIVQLPDWWRLCNLTLVMEEEEEEAREEEVREGEEEGKKDLFSSLGVCVCV